MISFLTFATVSKQETNKETRTQTETETENINILRFLDYYNEFNKPNNDNKIFCNVVNLSCSFEYNKYEMNRIGYFDYKFNISKILKHKDISTSNYYLLIFSKTNINITEKYLFDNVFFSQSSDFLTENFEKIFIKKEIKIKNITKFKIITSFQFNSIIYDYTNKKINENKISNMKPKIENNFIYLFDYDETKLYLTNNINNIKNVINLCKLYSDSEFIKYFGNNNAYTIYERFIRNNKNNFVEFPIIDTEQETIKNYKIYFDM